MGTTHLLDQPVADQAAAVAADPAVAADLTREAQRRIGADTVHAWVVLSDRAEQDAASRTGGPLAGVPLGVKDIIDVAGLPTRCGSVITSPAPVEKSAACVQRLERLGAVVQGKTVTTEFAYFAPGPTDNPAAPGHSPGGSSSGSAAAVAAGHVPLALGSQTAGSLTRPASYCGVAGLVAPVGSADLTGVAGLSPALDSLGVVARTVADLRTVFHALSDTSSPAQEQATSVPEPAGLLVWRGSNLGPVETVMAGVLATLTHGATAAGLMVDVFDQDDHIQTLAADHATIMSYQAAREHPEFADDPRLSAPLRELVSAGLTLDAEQFEHATYRRERSRVHLAPLFQDSVIVGPAALGPAPAGLGATGSPILSRPWQALGLPVVTVPGAVTPDGRPLGVQVIGWPGREEQLFATAAAIEAILQPT